MLKLTPAQARIVRRMGAGEELICSRSGGYWKLSDDRIDNRVANNLIKKGVMKKLPDEWSVGWSRAVLTERHEDAGGGE